ncbi:MAG: DUF721 domain-containing protein, partial [Oscillospiraceae bacterium]|nr:DUF721 domain-containing protein [Oscillospiraceae bacterium]
MPRAVHRNDRRCLPPERRNVHLILSVESGVLRLELRYSLRELVNNINSTLHPSHSTLFERKYQIW